MNACTWRAPMVTLCTGEQVPSDSQAWRLQCEAYHVLAMPYHKREEFYETCTRRRGADAVAALKSHCYDLEPYYVLDLPNKPQRNGYLEKVEHRFGPNARDALREKVLAIHRERHPVAEQVLKSA